MTVFNRYSWHQAWWWAPAPIDALSQASTHNRYDDVCMCVYMRAWDALASHSDDDTSLRSTDPI